MSLVPIGDVEIERLAEALTDMHRDNSHAGATHALADPAAALEAVKAAVDDGPGVAVLDGSTVVGYFIGPLPRVPGSSTARLRPVHHAARADDARSLYRLMYGAISSQLVAAGCMYHSLPVLTAQSAAADTFFELGFGVDQIDGILPIPDAVGTGSASGVRVATDSDLDQVVELAIELMKYHSRAPMFHAALLDVASIRQSAAKALEDDRSAVVVAEEGGRLVAMAEAEQAGSYPEAVDIGMNIVTADARAAGLGTAMLGFLLEWARSREYRYCTVGWTASNLVSDSFYRSRGFVPVRYRLHRRIDPRVAWANEALDYTAFPSRPR